jgi:hypothetical protein
MRRKRVGMFAIAHRGWYSCTISTLADLAGLAVDCCYRNSRLVFLDIYIFHHGAFPASFFCGFPAAKAVWEGAAVGGDCDES